MNKKRIIISRIAFAIGVVAVIMSRIHPGRYLFDAQAYWHGYNGVFWDTVFVGVFCLCGIICSANLFFESRKSVVKICMTVIIAACFVCFGYLMLSLIGNHDKMSKKVVFVSDDGTREIIDAGGDVDSNGNSSGFKHYATTFKDDKVYFFRAFYTYEEDFTPQIKWYEDGFWVSAYCPEDKSGDVSLVPESTEALAFRYEKRDDGFFFFYD